MTTNHPTPEDELVERVFRENILDQAARLGVHPREDGQDRPGAWMQRVRKAAMLEALRTRDEAARSSTTEVELGAHFPEGPWYQPDKTWAGHCQCGVGFTGSNGQAARLAWAAHVAEALQSKDHSHAG